MYVLSLLSEIFPPYEFIYSYIQNPEIQNRLLHYIQQIYHVYLQNSLLSLVAFYKYAL